MTELELTVLRDKADYY